MKTGHVYCIVSLKVQAQLRHCWTGWTSDLSNCSLLDDNLCLYGKEEIKPETFKTLTLRYNLIKIGSRRGLSLDLMRFMPGYENKL